MDLRWQMITLRQLCQINPSLQLELSHVRFDAKELGISTFASLSAILLLDCGILRAPNLLRNSSQGSLKVLIDLKALAAGKSPKNAPFVLLPLNILGGEANEFFCGDWRAPRQAINPLPIDHKLGRDGAPLHSTLGMARSKKCGNLKPIQHWFSTDMAKKSKDGLRDIARATRQNRDARITRLPCRMLQHKCHMCLVKNQFFFMIPWQKWWKRNQPLIPRYQESTQP